MSSVGRHEPSSSLLGLDNSGTLFEYSSTIVWSLQRSPLESVLTALKSSCLPHPWIPAADCVLDLYLPLLSIHDALLRQTGNAHSRLYTI